MNPNIEIINSIFSKGIETYNSDTKSIVNAGGVKLWWENNWKLQNRIFFNEHLFSAIRDLPVGLYIITRAKLNEHGRPLVLPNGNGYQRETIGLMLYTQFNQNSMAAEKFKAKILQDLPFLEGYVLCGSEILAEAPYLGRITEMVTSVNGVRTPMRVEGTIFLMLPSGSQGSSQLWGYKSKSDTKTNLNTRTTSNTAADDIDITELA